MITKPNFLNIRTIKQLFLRTLLVMGLVTTIAALSIVPALWAEQDTSQELKDGSGKHIGTAETSVDANGNKTVTISYTAGQDAGKTVTTVTDKSGQPVSSTTLTHNAAGGYTRTTTDAKTGNVTTQVPGAAAGETDYTVRDKSGQVISTKIYVSQGVDGYTNTTTDYKTGNVTTQVLTNNPKDPHGSTNVITVTDKAGKLVSKETKTIDGATGDFTKTTTDYKTGKVTTEVLNGSSLKDVTTVTDKNGKLVSTTTTTPGATGGSTSVTTDAKTGKVTTDVKDASGKDVTTVTDKGGKLVSTTTTTPGATGGSTSVTMDKHGKVVSTTTTGPDGNVVSQTGKNKKFADTGAQSTGGTQTSQGSGKHKDKQNFQADVFHQAKEKSNFQDSGSSGASSGSGQQMHHGKH